MPDQEDLRNRRLLLAIFYRGPWDRLSGFCYGLRKDGSLKWNLPAEPRGLKWVLAEIAEWADMQDLSWRNRHVQNDTTPHKRWRTRP